MNSRNKVILIIVIILVVLCCLFSVVAAGGAGIFTFIKGMTPSPSLAPTPLSNIQSPAPVDEATVTLQEEATAPAEPTLPPQPPAVQQPDTTFSGIPLGFSRAELMKTYDVFVFQNPTTQNGVEMVTGYHKWLCIDKDCAALTLGGPADNLTIVVMAVPIDPNDIKGTLTAIMLLGDVAMDITKDQSFSNQVITDFTNAANGQKTLDNKYNVNGLTVWEKITPNKSHYVAAIAFNASSSGGTK